MAKLTGTVYQDIFDGIFVMQLDDGTRWRLYTGGQDFQPWPEGCDIAIAQLPDAEVIFKDENEPYSFNNVAYSYKLTNCSSRDECVAEFWGMVGKRTTLQGVDRVQSEAGVDLFVTLNDGTSWFVHEDGVDTVAEWYPGSEVQVEELPSDELRQQDWAFCSYSLVNHSDGGERAIVGFLGGEPRVKLNE